MTYDELITSTARPCRIDSTAIDSLYAVRCSSSSRLLGTIEISINDDYNWYTGAVRLMGTRSGKQTTAGRLMCRRTHVSSRAVYLTCIDYCQTPEFFHAATTAGQPVLRRH